MPRPRFLVLLSIVLILPAAPLPGLADKTDADDFNQQVTKPVHDAVKIRQGTQKEADQWRDEKEKLVAHYERLENERVIWQDRRSQLQESVQAAMQRVAEKQKELTDIDQIRSRIEPFLKNQAAQLRQHLADDLPFLLQERELRIQRLDDLMTDPEVTVSEKYRKVMEALLVEAEYGNTIEVYQQTIRVEHTEMLVNVFRLGRISLFYQTLDLQQCGVFEVATGDWKPLSEEYNRDISAAIEMGSKRKPVELLNLPLGRMSVQ